jgi:hypothetical protein
MVAHSPNLKMFALEQIRPHGFGLEIAPYFDPFLLKQDYSNLFYTDYLSNHELLEKAKQNPGFIDGGVLPEIDFVWSPGVVLSDCVPSGVRFDYAVASHVMEHVPNPIGWMNEILATMADGGRLALFLPDRRTNMDRDRNLTTFGELVGLWASQPSVPTAMQVADFLAHSIDIDSAEVLAGRAATAPGRSHYPDQEVVSFASWVATTGRYLDIHCTVWEPEQFVAVIRRAAEAGLMNVDVSQTCDDLVEFAVILTKRGSPRLSPPRAGIEPAKEAAPGRFTKFQRLVNRKLFGRSPKP